VPVFGVLFDLVRRGGRSPNPAVGAADKLRKEAALKYIAQIAQLRDAVTDKNVHEKAAEFYSLVKAAFKESLSLTYAATFQEIGGEVEKNQQYSSRLRDEVTSFLSDVAMMEYGYEEFRQIVEEKKHEKEQRLREYIAEMERDGDHLRKDTKQKIAGIVSESVPHTDREFLVRMVDRFRGLLHQMF